MTHFEISTSYDWRLYNYGNRDKKEMAGTNGTWFAKSASFHRPPRKLWIFLDLAHTYTLERMIKVKGEADGAVYLFCALYMHLPLGCFDHSHFSFIQRLPTETGRVGLSLPLPTMHHSLLNVLLSKAAANFRDARAKPEPWYHVIIDSQQSRSSEANQSPYLRMPYQQLAPPLSMIASLSCLKEPW